MQNDSNFFLISKLLQLARKNYFVAVIPAGITGIQT